MKSEVFSGVEVGLPSKFRGSEAEEEWQEVDWVKWSSGELEADTDSFLLIFKPSGAAGSVKPKPLGNLLHASSVGHDSRSLSITTSDALHRLYLLTFSDERSMTDFSRLAERARASYEAGLAADASPAAAPLDEDMQLLQREVCEALAGRWPLVFAGAEVVGPDPRGDAGSEALLGSGLIVLLDPPDDGDGRIGKYELRFYTVDEGGSEPLKKFDIGPRMTLKRQEDAGGTEPAFTFSLDEGIQGVPRHTISFDSESTSAGFARDFRVRQRLMGVSLRTAKTKRVAGELRAEIDGLKSRSCSATLFRCVSMLVLLLLLAAGARLGMLVAADSGIGGTKPLAAHVAVLREEALVLARLAQSSAAVAGSKACQLACGTMAGSSGTCPGSPPAGGGV